MMIGTMFLEPLLVLFGACETVLPYSEPICALFILDLFFKF